MSDPVAVRYAVSRVVDVRRRPDDGSVERIPRDVTLALPLEVDEVGEIRKYKCVIPFTPPSKNQYDGLPAQWQHGIKQRWMFRIFDWATEMQLPKNVTKIGLSAVIVFPSAGYSRDPQNYAATLWNFVPDALENRRHGSRRGQPFWGYGLIPDDRDGRIAFGPNLGIRFKFDERKGVPKKRRHRTYIGISVRVGG